MCACVYVCKVLREFGDGDASDTEPGAMATNVEEYEETLGDGTVVKRRVVTTTQQQLTTEKVVLERHDDDDDDDDDGWDDSRAAADDAVFEYSADRCTCVVLLLCLLSRNFTSGCCTQLFSRFGYQFNKHLLTYLLTYLPTYLPIVPWSMCIRSRHQWVVFLGGS